MKKLLIAAAAMTAVAGVAQAQSVTLYGVMDAGIYSAKGVTANNGKASGVQSSGDSTSRFGFMGTEDLGGGLKASFKLESEIAPVNGTTDSSRLWHRDAYLALSDAKLGTVLLGRTYTFGYASAIKFDALGGNTGSAWRQGYLGIGSAGRLDNVLAYVSPSVAGVSAGFAYSSKTSEVATWNTPVAETAGCTSCGKAYNAALNYEAGKVAATVGYIKANDSTGAKANDQTYAYATYDFGPAKLHLGYVDKDTVGAAEKAKATSIGLSAPVTAKVKVAAQYTSIKHSTGLAANNDADGMGFKVTYDLSKRTALYAIYSQVNNDSGAAVQGSSMQSATVTAVAGQDQKVTAIGVKHSF